MKATNEIIWDSVQRVSESSNCEKRHVGCIIVNGLGELVAAGYNYHHNDVCDCDTTKSAEHAEIMAVNNIPIEKREETLYAYVNHKPCERCNSILTSICKEVYVNPTSIRFEQEDKVNPKHYAAVDGVPSIRFFESAARSKEGYQDYLHLTSMKYVYRLWNKDEPKVNIGKAKWFLEELERSLDEMDK